MNWSEVKEIINSNPETKKQYETLVQNRKLIKYCKGVIKYYYTPIIMFLFIMFLINPTWMPRIASLMGIFIIVVGIIGMEIDIRNYERELEK